MLGTTLTNKASVGETQINVAEQDIVLRSKSTTLKNINIILVIDISGSMGANNKFANALNAARSFVNQAFAEGNDKGMTMTINSFSYRTVTWADAVKTKSEALSALDALEENCIEWNTRMDLGLLGASEAIGKLAALNGNDTILVFLSDGAPTAGDVVNTAPYLIKTSQMLRSHLQAF